MEMDTKTEGIAAIFLGDNSSFTYSVRQVEITSILGAAVAVLDEYFITGSGGETYKLYKTNEGNWYDMADVNEGVNKSVLMALKLGIDGIRNIH